MKPPFVLTVVVWGYEYTQKFLRFALPTFLSPGNIPELAKNRETEFLIVTTAVGRMTIERSPIFETLSALVKVTFIVMDFDGLAAISTQAGNQLSMVLMSMGHKAACEYAAPRGAYCSFLAPDILLSDGTLAYFDRRAAEGVRAILVPGFRVIEEEVRKLKFLSRGALTMPPRVLARIIMDHTHPEVRSYILDKGFSHCPNYVIWRLGRDRWLTHAFHHHPLLVDVSRARSFSSLNRDTIDGDFLGHVIDDWSTIEIVRDSDNVTLASLTPRRDGATVFAGAAPEPSTVANWAHSTIMTPLHRHLFTQAHILHAGPMPADEDLPLDEIAGFVYEGLKRPVAPQTMRALVRLASSMGRHRAREILSCARFAAAVPLRVVRRGARVGRLLRESDAKIEALRAENRELLERLTAIRARGRGGV